MRFIYRISVSFIDILGMDSAVSAPDATGSSYRSHHSGLIFTIGGIISLNTYHK